MYLALLVGAHGVVILWAIASARVGRRSRRPMVVSLLGWALASIAAGLLSLPLVRVVTEQSGQVGWIKPIGPNTITQVVSTQLFYQNDVFALLAWALALVGLALLVRRGIRLVRARRASRLEPEGALAEFESAYLHAGWSPTILQLAVVWFVVPTLLLIGASTLMSPLYSPRYMAYTAPAFAMLMAVGILALRWKPLVAAVTAVLVALSVMQLVHDRTTTVKADSDWAAIARIVSEERAQEAPGTTEAVIFGPRAPPPEGDLAHRRVLVPGRVPRYGRHPAANPARRHRRPLGGDLPARRPGRRGSTAPTSCGSSRATSRTSGTTWPRPSPRAALPRPTTGT